MSDCPYCSRRDGHQHHVYFDKGTTFVDGSALATATPVATEGPREPTVGPWCYHCKEAWPCGCPAGERILATLKAAYPERGAAPPPVCAVWCGTEASNAMHIDVPLYCTGEGPHLDFCARQCRDAGRSLNPRTPSSSKETR